MHRSLLALAALALISCNKEDPAALFADVSYQLRCLDCTPVSADSPRRDFSVTNGQDGTTLSCNASEGLISLTILGDGFKLNILDARPGDDPGNRCEVQIAEGSGNEYRGGCKAIGASGSQPCEVELVRDGEGSFDGTVECHGIAHRNTAAAIRHVVAPGTRDEPAQISVQGCAGL
jgi:hypothetical protein